LLFYSDLSFNSLHGGVAQLPNSIANLYLQNNRFETIINIPSNAKQLNLSNNRFNLVYLPLIPAARRTCVLYGNNNETEMNCFLNATCALCPDCNRRETIRTGCIPTTTMIATTTTMPTTTTITTSIAPSTTTIEASTTTISSTSTQATTSTTVSSTSQTTSTFDQTTKPATTTVIVLVEKCLCFKLKHTLHNRLLLLWMMKVSLVGQLH
jgi:hypothetical protein